VLAYVYQLKAALAGRGRVPDVPTLQVPPELDPHNKPKAPEDADLFEDEAATREGAEQ
jgi:flagellar biosynthetic protein FlhB